MDEIQVGDNVQITSSYPSCGIMRAAIGQVGKVTRIDIVRSWKIAEVKTKERSWLVQIQHLKKV